MDEHDAGLLGVISVKVISISLVRSGRSQSASGC